MQEVRHSTVADLGFWNGGFQCDPQEAEKCAKCARCRRVRGQGPPENFWIFDLLRSLLVQSGSKIASVWWPDAVGLEAVWNLNVWLC